MQGITIGRCRGEIGFQGIGHGVPISTAVEMGSLSEIWGYSVHASVHVERDERLG